MNVCVFYTFNRLGGVGVYVSDVPFSVTAFNSGNSCSKSWTCCVRILMFRSSICSNLHLFNITSLSSCLSFSCRSFSRLIFSLLVRNFACASLSSSRSHCNWNRLIVTMSKFWTTDFPKYIKHEIFFTSDNFFLLSSFSSSNTFFSWSCLLLFSSRSLLRSLSICKPNNVCGVMKKI